MKNKNYFALYAFDDKVEHASRESYALKIALGFMLVLFSVWTILAGH